MDAVPSPSSTLFFCALWLLSQLQAQTLRRPTANSPDSPEHVHFGRALCALPTPPKRGRGRDKSVITKLDEFGGAFDEFGRGFGTGARR